MVMGHHASHPLPNPSFGIQLGRVGGLGREDKSPCRFLLYRLDRSPSVLFPAVMNDQQALIAIVTQQLSQEGGKVCLAQATSQTIMRPAAQGGDGPIDMHFRMVVPCRDLRDRIRQTPLRRQGSDVGVP
jgi:hypothetical protein